LTREERQQLQREWREACDRLPYLEHEATYGYQTDAQVDEQRRRVQELSRRRNAEAYRVVQLLRNRLALRSPDRQDALQAAEDLELTVYQLFEAALWGDRRAS
jgi:hypothetical protein